jgi:hypothetical protein
LSVGVVEDGLVCILMIVMMGGGRFIEGSGGVWVAFVGVIPVCSWWVWVLRA